MPLLRIVSGAGEGTVIPLADSALSIGRDARAHLRVLDPKSSRTHAEVRQEHGRWLLVDLGSSNGTWSGDARIESTPLTDGFIFRIGKTLIRFESAFPVAEEAGDTTAVDPNDPSRLVGLEEDQPSILTMVGARAAASAPGAEADDGLARANAYLALLHDIVRKSNDARTREELFEVLDEAAAEALEGDRCAVFLPTPGGWTLWPAHERRLRARYGAVPYARTLLQAVRARPAPLLCTRQGDINPSASMMQAGVRSAMAAPLRIGHETHALLYVDRITGTRVFTRAELEFLAAVANQLAVQLHNREHVASLEAEVERLQAQPAATAPALVWRDAAMQDVDAFIGKAGQAPQPVLIRGEPGTGKELIARLIHHRSARAGRPLQVVACAALPDAEGTLFGRAAEGDEARPGLIELVDQGTLLLKDVDALPASAQALLLGVLDRGEFARPGDGALRRVDVRVIAATSRERDDGTRGGLRADLRERLDVLGIPVPPLRARPGDVEALAEHFLSEHAAKLGQPAKRLAPDTRAVLLRCPWPGNARQLKNAIERACVLASGEVIRAQDLPEAVRGAEPSAGAAGPITALADVERAHIQRVLEHCGGNKKAAAEILGIDRSTLYAKLKQYGQM